jgi:spore germination protein YaaH
MGKNKWATLVFLGFLVSGALVGLKAEAASKINTPKKASSILKVFYFKDDPAARTSLFEHPNSINVLAPQVYSLNDAGLLSGTIDPQILAFTEKHKIKVMPLVTNANFSNDTAEAIFGDSAKQDTAINALITEAEQQKYWGWQIDFEGMNASDKDQYSAFIKKMSTSFQEHNLILSVAVIAQISNNPSDYPKDLWGRVIGVYDYSALASSVDFVSIMSYDDPDSKGPISPYPWLKKIITYSLKYIPPQKLSLGIPFYYWQWNTDSGKLISVGGYAGVKNTLKKRHVIAGYSVTNQAPYLKYVVKKNHYMLWYENSKSVAEKISLIKKYKLQGFSAWLLGLETPTIFSALK